MRSGGWKRAAYIGMDETQEMGSRGRGGNRVRPMRVFHEDARLASGERKGRGNGGTSGKVRNAQDRRSTNVAKMSMPEISGRGARIKDGTCTRGQYRGIQGLNDSIGKVTKVRRKRGRGDDCQLSHNWRGDRKGRHCHRERKGWFLEPRSLTGHPTAGLKTVQEVMSSLTRIGGASWVRAGKPRGVVFVNAGLG
ncbi:hypothetical protein SERLA73DRAFT_150216 [Serpula lacrymans var. lacrymans S7.3]|uniref:Uncharacterized protein n=1 Tax=Serpula lacrymans var. lacrymans (strain S7.3) TaxID=936435 RepID=F8PLJ9_SERL3|nr:hypothetical protein SERLA73DRAFT_150216 [Serpula lacrymans var. lacrymans S7.3]